MEERNPNKKISLNKGNKSLDIETEFGANLPEKKKTPMP